jgi:hypothetical protein
VALLRQQLDAARKMLDERTHAVIHLEHHIEQQDLEFEERAATIANLEQQLQVPPDFCYFELVVDMLERQGGLTFVILSG